MKLPTLFPFLLLLPLCFPLTLRKSLSSLSDPAANLTLAQNASLSRENASFSLHLENDTRLKPSENATNAFTYKPLRGDANLTSNFKESLGANVVISDISSETVASNYDNLGPDADKYLFIGSGKTQTSLQEITTKWKTPTYAAK